MAYASTGVLGALGRISVNDKSRRGGDGLALRAVTTVQMNRGEKSSVRYRYSIAIVQR